MEIIIQTTPEAASKVAARIVARVLREKPEAVLGLPTGNTPLPLYRELIRLHRAGQADFRRVTTFNLDEYVGLAPEHPRSFYHFMWENFFRHLNIKRGKVHLPDGLAKDIPAHCDRYEKEIRAMGGIDLQILGIGADGHIAFNEPTSSLASRTRIKTLTPETRRDHAREFGGLNRVPHHAITMGIGTILEARECLLLAFGGRKARAIAGAVEGPVSSMNPASALQLHPVVRVCVDRAAAKGLKRAAYYRWVYENKPGWQVE